MMSVIAANFHGLNIWKQRNLVLGKYFNSCIAEKLHLRWSSSSSCLNWAVVASSERERVLSSRLLTLLSISLRHCKNQWIPTWLNEAGAVLCLLSFFTLKSKAWKLCLISCLLLKLLLNCVSALKISLISKSSNWPIRYTGLVMRPCRKEELRQVLPSEKMVGVSSLTISSAIDAACSCLDSPASWSSFGSKFSWYRFPQTRGSKEFSKSYWIFILNSLMRLSTEPTKRKL